jgi:hypothetical protein
MGRWKYSCNKDGAMTLKEAMKRIEELEKRVKELEARPADKVVGRHEYHYHYHYPQPEPLTPTWRQWEVTCAAAPEFNGFHGKTIV